MKKFVANDVSCDGASCLLGYMSFLLVVAESVFTLKSVCRAGAVCKQKRKHTCYHGKTCDVKCLKRGTDTTAHKIQVYKSEICIIKLFEY